MRKFFIPLLLFIALNFSCHAQQQQFEIGILYGIGKSNLINHSILNKRYNSLSSFSLGINFFYGLNSKITVSSGIFIDQRGGKFKSYEREFITTEEPPLIILGDTATRLNKNEFAYMTFPFKVTYGIPLNDKLSLNVGIGGFYSRLIKQLWNYELLDVFALIEPGTLQFSYKNNDFGILSVIEVAYDTTKILKIKLSFNYLRGLTNITEEKEENIKAFHQRIYIEAGVCFSLN